MHLRQECSTVKTSLLLCVLSCGTICAHGAHAAAPSTGGTGYPARPVRFVVPYPTGGAPDLMARQLGTHLSETWGQQFLADNRAGANGTIACEITAKAPGDGYTIQMGSVATHAINPHLYKKLPYNPLKDFTYITQIGYTPMIVTAHPSVGASNLKELFAAAKAKPGVYTFGSSGSGSVGHLAGEMVAIAGGVKLIHVPYKGIATATTDLLGGQISMTVGNMLNALPHIRSGRVRPIAVTSAKRAPLLPDVEAVAESHPGFEAILWWGVFGPASLPRPLVDKLNGEMVKFLGRPETKERWAKEGTVITGSTPEHLAALVKTDLDRWGKAVKASGAKAD